ncbi:MAG TPA: hypothetical protein DCF33_06410, partial [Saprospirales bacterium]|nr:hypothetical protein [Saprospirales bacterium]
MKQLILTLAFGFSCLFSDAQNTDPILDSLKRPLPAGASVRARAERLDKIIWKIFIDANLQYENDAMQLDSLYRCCIHGKTGDPHFEKTLGAKVMFYRGASLVEEQPDAALPLLKDAIRQYAGMGDSAGMALGFSQLIYTASRLGDSLSFASYLDQTVALAVYIKDPFLKSVTLSDMGINCYDFGRFAEAATYYFQSLELIEKFRTSALLDMQHDVYHNLNGIYNRLGDWDNALIYMQKAVQCAKERGQDPNVHCIGLANSYIGKREYQRALEVLVEAENKLKGDEIGQTEAAINYTLSNCYRNLGNPKAALACAEKSVRLLPISVNAPFGAVAVEELAQCQFALGKTDKALGHALLAYETYLSAKQNGGLVRATELLSNIYKANGNYRKALEYSELRYKYQTLVERQQSTRQLAFGEFNRENEVKNARREAEIQAELTQQRNIRYALYAGLIVFALLALLLYNRFRFKQKTAEQ